MALPFDLEQTWLYPLPEFSLIALQGEDRRRFLHNQTTNAVEARAVGEWFETVFVNSTGRTLELATVYVRQDSLWLQVEAGQKISSGNGWTDLFSPLTKWNCGIYLPIIGRWCCWGKRLKSII